MMLVCGFFYGLVRKLTGVSPRHDEMGQASHEIEGIINEMFEST